MSMFGANENRDRADGETRSYAGTRARTATSPVTPGSQSWPVWWPP